MKEYNPLQWHIDHAEHYLALGQKDVYLWRHYGDQSDFPKDDMPWEYVTDVKGGGGYRWGIPIDINFVAPHPCGLTFHFSVSLEDHTATGASTLDLEQIIYARDHLPFPMREKLQQHVAGLLAETDKLFEKDREYFARRKDYNTRFHALVTTLLDEDPEREPDYAVDLYDR